MTRQIGIFGLKPTDAQVRVRQRVGGAERPWTAVATVSPGEWEAPAPPPAPPPTVPGQDAHLRQYETVANGGTATLVPDLSAVSVTVSRAAGPAPLGVTFALSSADPAFHALVLFGTVDWSFSADSGENYEFAHLAGTFAGETAGTARGPYVGHVYVGAGTHTWTCTLHYPGLSSRTITGTITTTAADTYFADQTIWYSPAYETVDAFYTAMAALETAEAGTSGIVGWADRTESEMKALMRVGNLRLAINEFKSPTTPLRVLIQAGTTYTALTTWWRLQPGNVRIDRFGTGADPILDFGSVEDQSGGLWVNFDSGGTINDIMNVDIRGPYDAADPGTALAPWYGVSGVGTTESVNHMTMFRVQVQGCYNNIDSNRAQSNWLVSDCHSTNWYNYGAWPSAGRGNAWVGTRIAQKVGAVNLGRRSTGPADTGDRETHEDVQWDGVYVKAPIHGPMRIASPSFGLGLHQLEMVSLNGWARGPGYDTSLTDLQQTAADAYQIQPCLRMITAVGLPPNPADQWAGHSHSLWRISFTGGAPPLTYDFQRKEQRPFGGDEYTLGDGLLVDECVLETGGMRVNYGRTAVRNSLIFAGFDGDGTTAIEIVSQTQEQPTDGWPSYVFANTFNWSGNLPNASNYQIVTTASNTRPVYQWDNADFMSGVAGSYTPPTYTNTGDTAAIVGAKAFDFTPVAGSNLLGEATRLSPRYAFGGAERPSPAAIGALEQQGVGVAFGALTLAGAGGVALPSGETTISDAGGTGLVVSSGFVVPDTGGGVTSGTVTFGTGTQWGVIAEARAYSVRTHAQMLAALASSGLQYGDKVRLRVGTYDTTEQHASTPRVRRSTAIGGTYTAPSDYGSAGTVGWYQGPNLDTGNYVRVLPHDGDTATIAGMLHVDGQSAANVDGIRFTGLTFAPGAGFIVSLAADDIAIDRCVFQEAATPVNWATGETVPTGLVDRISAGAGSNNFKAIDNIIQESLFGVRIYGNASGVDVIGNRMRNIWGDGIQLNAGTASARVGWNIVTDKKDGPAEAEYHGDFIQVNGNGDNYTIYGNLLFRGAGYTDRVDGQGVFLAGNTEARNGVIIAGNLYSGVLVRGVSVGKSENPIAVYNTVISHDLFTSGTSVVAWDDDASNIGGYIARNVADGFTLDSLATSAGNITTLKANRAADYSNPSFAVDPFSDLSGFLANWSARPAGALALTPQPGAIGNFDYVNRTFDVALLSPITLSAVIARDGTTISITPTTNAVGTIKYLVSTSPVTWDSVDAQGTAAAKGTVAVTATGAQSAISITGLDDAETYYIGVVQVSGGRASALLSELSSGAGSIFDFSTTPEANRGTPAAITDGWEVANSTTISFNAYMTWLDADALTSGTEYTVTFDFETSFASGTYSIRAGANAVLSATRGLNQTFSPASNVKATHSFNFTPSAADADYVGVLVGGADATAQTWKITNITIVPA